MNMYFIDWLFIIAVLVVAAHFLWPEFTALASSTASVIQSFFGS